jgi:hypothetical protein
VNSQISFQGPSATKPPEPPLHANSASSKDYVNQAVINENQHKHKLSSSQHKHRKSHKSSSQNDKRYHSGNLTKKNNTTFFSFRYSLICLCLTDNWFRFFIYSFF